MWNIRTPHIATKTRGLTLVEMLMATALTLIMFAAVAQIFGMMGTAMRDARATIELSGNLRSVSTHLQHDLDNVTVDVLPWVQPGANQGYFEIIEGPDRDVDFAASDIIDDTTFPDYPGTQGGMAGDADDIVCFTAYSKDQPFVGLIFGELKPLSVTTHPHKYWVDTTSGTFTTITSHYAEIVYFTKHTPLEDINGNGGRDADETVTLYRRVLLIRPDIFVGDPSSDGPTESYPLSYVEAMNYYDLSMWTGASTSNWQTNSLEDLQTRSRRVAHAPYSAAGIQVDEDSGGSAIYMNVNVPGVFDAAPIRPHALMTFEQLNHAFQWDASGANLRDRTGEDVMLTNTLAFDVRVFDSIAPVRNDSAASPSLALSPGDPGFTAASTTDAMAGAFVDLNWSRTAPTAGTSYHNQTFQFGPNTKSRIGNITIYGGNSSAIFGGTTPTAGNINSSFFRQNPSMMSTASLNYGYYDTWPYSYEVDGVDQDGDGTIDEGTNGFDDDSDGIVDDHVATDFNGDNAITGTLEPSELETQPPYSKALRAVSITVRAIEGGTRQVRQDTIVADFLPN